MNAYVGRSGKKYNGIIRFILVFFVFILNVSCSHKPSINNFESKIWKEDTEGCLGNREKLAGVLEAERKQLKGINEEELVNFLGKPNAVQLLERQQRYYIYWISNSSKCKNAKGLSKEVKIRLSVLNKVTEVIF